MGASRFVGRVGGLAVALGVGAAAFSGAGAAWAETSDPGSESTPRASSSDDSAAPPRGRTAAAKAPAAARAESRTRQQRNSRSEAPPKPAGPSIQDGPASVTIETAIMQRVLEAHVREQLDALADLRVALA